MIIHVSQKDSKNWDVIDLDSGKRIPLVQWANDETGRYEVIAVDKDNNFIEKWCPITLGYEVQYEQKVGNIKLVKISKEE